MTIPDPQKIYPWDENKQIVYLKNVIRSSHIEVGDFTFYHDFIHDPQYFEDNNVLYHYPINHDKLIIGKFCSIACSAKFLMNGGNHTLNSLSTYTFPLFGSEWNTGLNITDSWDNKGNIIIGNDVWIGFEALILAGVTIGDGAIIGARAVVTHDVPPYTIVAGVPAKPVRKRFSEENIQFLQKIKWWDWPLEKISANIRHIQSGDIQALKNQI